MDTFTIWKLIFELLTDPQPRQKLSNVNTIDQVLHLLTTCKNIVILTGAGVSIVIYFIINDNYKRNYAKTVILL